MTTDTNGRSHAAAGTPGGGQFQPEAPAYDERVSLTSNPAAEFIYDRQELRITGGEALHDGEEHGLSVDGVAASIKGLRIAGQVSDASAPPAAFTTEMAKVYGYTPETHDAKWVNLAGWRFTTAVVYQRKGTTLTLPQAYQQVAHQASLGQELDHGWAHESELPAGTNISRLRHESASLREGLASVAGEAGAGWLMHGLDAEQFGYNVINADS
ncbi:hypothetical protein ACWGJ9_10400 [Curtobacterium citreum]